MPILRKYQLKNLVYKFTSASIPKLIPYFLEKIHVLRIDSKVKFYESTSESQY